jgi:lysozyme
MAFETNALGIDVSLWQKDLDWAALKTAGVTFAFAKATQGDAIVDPNFARNWPAIKAAGIVRGAYHFFKGAIDPLRQAAFFVQTVKHEKGDLPLALDVENSGGLAPAALADAIHACLNEIERLSGVHPIIYTGPNFWNTSVAAPNAPDWTANYRLWIANYTAASKPTLPQGWTAWDIWQYTEQGKLNGYAGNLDLDHYVGTVDDLAAWVGGLPKLSSPVAADVPAEVAALVANYIQALNARDFDGLAALYAPTGVRTAASATAQGRAGIRQWYVEWLSNQFPGGNFALGAIGLVDTATWSFPWTCHSTNGDAQGQDTVGVQSGKLQYHSTSLE